MMSLESITSAIPPNNECGEEEEGLSEDSECEQEVWSEDINANQDRKEDQILWVVKFGKDHNQVRFGEENNQVLRR
ncbi:hypothetical protein Acr_16g0006720 [Actinidia rufa]|uniref:Uncharacterized protein n=1 Tax=Actinidia rufa TaxID=165716 RepID=A0A7J0G0Z4_9ERIC|nr:hypothetical protein Acr_16g0006720 [Actinidia rufa]